MPKKIAASVSSLVDLKAELFRKQEQRKKVQTDAAPSVIKTSFKGNLVPDKEKDERTKAERSANIRRLEAAVAEEERQLRRSRQALEAKARLYEKMSSGEVVSGGRGDEDGPCLVNFDLKRRGNTLPTESDDEDEAEADWVEFTDSLGRTRRCPRDELPQLLAADEARVAVQPAASGVKADLLSDDMRREAERRDWEETASAPIGPTHYQQVLNTEARGHGVAYFEFAKDEAGRQEQMQELDRLRQQTIDQRTRNEVLKEKRQKLLKERLEKVRKRKQLSTNDDAADDDDGEEGAEVSDSVSKIPLPAAPTDSATAADDDDSPPKRPKQQVRPWDVGKTISQERWVENRRDDRPAEFAPPTVYFRK